jgi:hypothetical protein
MNFFFLSSVAEVLNHLNSNQRLLRSHPKSGHSSTANNGNTHSLSPNGTAQNNNHIGNGASSAVVTQSSNVFNTAAALTSRFMSDPQGKKKKL